MLLTAGLFTGCSDDSSTTTGNSGASTTTTAAATTATGTGGTQGTGGAGGAGGAGASAGAAGGDAVTTVTAATGTGGGNDACSTCVTTKCAAEVAKCNADNQAACAGLQQCLEPCVGDTYDTDCAFDCFGEYPTVSAEVTLLGDCVGKQCATAGGSCASSDPDGLDPCGVCMAAKCETAWEDCVGHDACRALVKCAAKCPNDASGDACRVQCGFSNAGGAAKAQALQSCLAAQCADSSCPGL